MKVEVYGQAQEEAIKLKMVSFGKGVRIVKVNDKGQYGVGDVLLEVYPQGVRRIKGFTDYRFHCDAFGRIHDITNVRR